MWNRLTRKKFRPTTPSETPDVLTHPCADTVRVLAGMDHMDIAAQATP